MPTTSPGASMRNSNRRELKVGHLMLSGCSSKEIARKLQISAETVKAHKKQIYGKLGIKSRSELFSIFPGDA